MYVTEIVITPHHPALMKICYRDCDTVVLEGPPPMEEQSVICLPQNQGRRQQLQQQSEVEVLQTNQTVQTEVQVAIF